MVPASTACRCQLLNELYEMKPYIKLFLFPIISLIAVSCKNNGEKSTINGTDSTQEEIFTSPDLSLYQLKGHVKECIIPGDDMGDFIYKFDENGNLISPKYEKIERDKNGAIIEYYNPETECTTRVKWEDGKVIGQTDLFGDIYNSSSTSYKYDNENNIAQSVQEGIAFVINYSNYKFDEFGNWISRTQEANGASWEESRYITYYGSDIGQERLLEYYKQKKEEEIQWNQEQNRLAEERRQEEQRRLGTEITISINYDRGSDGFVKYSSVSSSHGHVFSQPEEYRSLLEYIDSKMLIVPSGEKWIFKGVEYKGCEGYILVLNSSGNYIDKKISVSPSTHETYTFYSGQKLAIRIRGFWNDGGATFHFIQKPEYD